MLSAIVAQKCTWKSLCKNENRNLEINENENRDKQFLSQIIADPMIKRQDKRQGQKKKEIKDWQNSLVKCDWFGLGQLFILVLHSCLQVRKTFIMTKMFIRNIRLTATIPTLPRTANLAS